MSELNWKILSQNNSTKPVVPANKHTYDLFNTTEKKGLVYGKRNFGVNLVWGDTAASNNISFQRKSGAKGPLTYGELVAINIRNGSFLAYQKRDYGINLAWRKVPSFEWQIMGMNEGETVETGKVLALYNTVENDFIFYDPRKVGINLKWLKDQGKFNDSFLKTAAKTALKVGVKYVKNQVK